jgi:hypothetical protein
MTPVKVHYDIARKRRLLHPNSLSHPGPFRLLAIELSVLIILGKKKYMHTEKRMNVSIGARSRVAQ